MVSPFDIAKNNRGNDEIGIYLSYKRLDEILDEAKWEGVDLGRKLERGSLLGKVIQMNKPIDKNDLIKELWDSRGENA